MPAILLQFPRRTVLLAVRASTATARELFAGWAVDGQAEEIARLAEIRVPFSMSQEVDQSYEVEDEDREEDDDEGALVFCGAA
jgi:hypothetical protein